MQIIIRCSDGQKEELEAGSPAPGLKLQYVPGPEAFAWFPQADAYLDLLYESDPWGEEGGLPEKPVIIHSLVPVTVKNGASVVRINAWPFFLSRPVVEAACPDAGRRTAAEAVFRQFGKEVAWLPDEPGFVAARVVCMIINEAYFALSEGVSTRDEIDTAMKLGTNYPFGPFEWARRIGMGNVVRLLQELGRREARYLPAPLLLREAAGEAAAP